VNLLINIIGSNYTGKSFFIEKLLASFEGEVYFVDISKNLMLPPYGFKYYFQVFIYGFLFLNFKLAARILTYSYTENFYIKDSENKKTILIFDEGCYKKIIELMPSKRIWFYYIYFRYVQFVYFKYFSKFNTIYIKTSVSNLTLFKNYIERMSFNSLNSFEFSTLFSNRILKRFLFQEILYLHGLKGKHVLNVDTYYNIPEIIFFIKQF
jgi:hypothetical protein